MYAPGPAVLEAGGYNTEVTFIDQGCVRGFGAVFIDVDHPELGESALAVYDSQDSLLNEAVGFEGESGGKLFRGIIAFDSEGNPQPTIARVHLVNGSVWPMSSCCEGVTLDDFRFSPPE